ncbi:MAG: filamentous hemagglutinin N-terminal domain-containing protein, partial [Rhizomicrobium sp.]
MQSTKLLLRGSASMLALAIATPFLASSALANPSGGTVTNGSASIANPSSNATDVQQTSEGVVIDWSSFNVGKGQTTTFIQPNAQAIAVNRIGSNNASQILGTLDANGRIVLINGNGILFGKGSQVDVGGLLATTSNASDADILSGKANFTNSGNANAQIVNRGTITASPGGFVALVAPSVTNTGTVQAKLGNVTLGGANNYTLDFNGDGLVSFATPAAGHGQVANRGLLSGASVTMDARSAEGAAVGVVNAGGTIVAQGASQQGGTIVLDGGDGGRINVSGSLNASGASGGGSIAVGYSGDSLAGNVAIEKGAVLSVDATQSGNGGSVKIDSQNDTEFNGLISAKGAGAAGTGGNVELSTKGVLQFTGFADTS